MRFLPPVAAPAVAVSLAGCGGSSPASTVTTPAGQPAAASPSSSPAGFAVKVLSVKRVATGPAKADPYGKTAWSSDIPAGSALVTVRYTLTNRTGAPITPLPSASVDYGPNAVPADEMVGWAGQATMHGAHDPRQVGAGQTVTLWRSWVLPTAQIPHAELTLDTAYGQPPVKASLR